MIEELIGDTWAIVLAVALVICVAIGGNAYVTHERQSTYRQCLAHQPIDACKSIKP